MVRRSLLMFAFKAIVFIKVFSLFTPIGATLNQNFFRAIFSRVVYPQVKWCIVSYHIFWSLVAVNLYTATGSCPVPVEIRTFFSFFTSNRTNKFRKILVQFCWRNRVHFSQIVLFLCQKFFKQLYISFCLFLRVSVLQSMLST